MKKTTYIVPDLETELFYGKNAVLLTSPQESPNMGLGGKWEEEEI